MKPLRSIPSRLLCLFIVPALLLAPGAVTPAAAFDFFGWFDPSSPVIHLPRLQAEFSARPSLKTIRGGSLEIPELGVDLDLRDDFGFTDSSFFIDLMTRLQLGRLGVRTHVSFRDFKGLKDLDPAAFSPRSEARLEYTAWRVGGDLDIIRYFGSRAGVNVDFDLMSPRFSESIETVGRALFIGEDPVTFGIHGEYNSTPLWGGMSVQVEGRVRWPLAGALVTEWEISAGVNAPRTVLGTLGIRGGYRNTTLEFDDREFLQNAFRDAEFKGNWDSIFGEIVYEY